jgi:hypothetical protein
MIADSAKLHAAERAIFAAATLGQRPDIRGPIFIVHSPRTGSTFFYQSLIAAFSLPYVANLTNDCFGHTPIIGLSIQASWPSHESIAETSRFGKTNGAMQPSEASSLMRRWFGGGHPSELVSCKLLEGQREHMRHTFAAAYALFDRPLIIKNAWNSFRVRALAEVFETAAFIWVRRDIEPSALSDLGARYVVQKDPEIWNSATPRNVEVLRLRPYWEQVVENQVEFARSISDQFAMLPPGRRAVLWYEDFIQDPAAELDRLAFELLPLHGLRHAPLLPIRRSVPPEGLNEEDRGRVVDFIAREGNRLAPHRYRPGRTRL